MSEYRVRATGDVKSQAQLRRDNPNISLPRSQWGSNVCEVLGIDPVTETPEPSPVGQYKKVVRNGVEQDANGNWVYAWTELDMFSEYTDEEGVVHTKEHQEQEYQATLDAQQAQTMRSQRDYKLQKTDFYALSDSTLSAEMETYRQALRDITDHANFPYLQDADWPVKPE